jgi:antirestriction protein ArdC
MTKNSDKSHAFGMRIIAALLKGFVPWRQGWSNGGHGGSLAHCNLLTDAEYRGGNPFFLVLAAWENGWSSRQWATLKQATLFKVRLLRSQGVKIDERVTTGTKGYKRSSFHYADTGELVKAVRTGEQGTEIFFWKRLSIREKQSDGTTKPKTIPMLRTFKVFNRDQLDLPVVDTPVVDTPVAIEPVADKLDALINGYVGGPGYRVGKPSYVPALDIVRLPPPEAFHTIGDRVSTTCHELTHSTGHANRLARPGIVDFDGFGSHQYGFEELVAECGAAMLCAHLGVASDDRQTEQHVAYIGAWIKTISADPDIVLRAAGQAQKAVDHILGRTWEDRDVKTTEAEA